MIIIICWWWRKDNWKLSSGCFLSSAFPFRWHFIISKKHFIEKVRLLWNFDFQFFFSPAELPIPTFEVGVGSEILAEAIFLRLKLWPPKRGIAIGLYRILIWLHSKSGLPEPQCIDMTFKQCLIIIRRGYFCLKIIRDPALNSKMSQKL